jgi:UV DNA damage endonuclease
VLISLIPESVPVARTRSLAPIHNAHHAAHHVLRFSYSTGFASGPGVSAALTISSGRCLSTSCEYARDCVDIPVDSEELKEALGRPPPVNSSYLPLPWKGRLGFQLFGINGDIFI